MINNDGKFGLEYVHGSKQSCTQIYISRSIEKALSRILSVDKITHNIKILDAGCGHGLSFTMLEKRFKPKRIIGFSTQDLGQVQVFRLSEYRVRTWGLPKL